MDLYGTHTSPTAPRSVISSTDGELGPGSTYISGTTETRPASDQQGSSQPSAGAPAVPAACLACRSKHLKCDGSPRCARCTSSNSECVYVASRRGYKGPRRGTAQNPNKRHASSSPDGGGGGGGGGPESCPMLLGATVAPGLTSTSFAGAGGAGPSPNVAVGGTEYLSAAASMNHLQPFRAAAAAPLPPPLAATMSIADRCFDSFYHHYHQAHPFVLPRAHLARLAHDMTAADGGGGDGLALLTTAMRHVGSLFVDAGPARASYLDEALRLCRAPQTPRDGFLVQALLLLAVALDGAGEQARARDLLGEAERVAVEIGLHTRGFAAARGRGCAVLEESWRRTWWDLYVCDGMVAGVHRATGFLLYDVAADVGLPCEEEEYLSGNIPQPPMYMEDFDDQLFTGEDRPFSSFAFRIAAIRNLGRFMRCPPMVFPDDENVARLDAHLTNWRLHLPPGKRDPIDKNCAPDEMLFQAHFITTACTIMLHQPHSQLDSSPTRAVNACAPYRPVATATTTGDSFFNNHTRHTIAAARDISRMITHAVPLHHHTHFFTCVITMAAIVHLSRWAQYHLVVDNDGEVDLREQIRLAIGALGTLSAFWRAAARAGAQVRGVAQDIYRAKKAQQIHPAFWVAFTQEEMINSLNVDEGVMGEIDSILSAVSSAPQ